MQQYTKFLLKIMRGSSCYCNERFLQLCACLRKPNGIFVRPSALAVYAPMLKPKSSRSFHQSPQSLKCVWRHVVFILFICLVTSNPLSIHWNIFASICGLQHRIECSMWQLSLQRIFWEACEHRAYVSINLAVVEKKLLCQLWCFSLVGQGSGTTRDDICNPLTGPLYDRPTVFYWATVQNTKYASHSG